MKTSYDVRIWKTAVYKGANKTTYTVRWSVAGQEKRSRPPYATTALADSFRSELVTAQRNGEPFEIDSGLPLSMLRKRLKDTTSYEAVTSYIDMKWKHASASYRRDIARTMMTAMVAMVTAHPVGFTAKELRKALMDWAFNKDHRANAPGSVTAILAWVNQNCWPISDLSEEENAGKVLAALSEKLDGTIAAGTTIRRNRAIFHNFLEFVVRKKKLLPVNPIKEMDTERVQGKAVRPVDKRSLPNPTQARALLAAVRERKPSGERVHAFLAVMYFAALRPEEVVSLYVRDITWPESELQGGSEREESDTSEWDETYWGEFSVSQPRPEVGKRWTDSGERHDHRRQPKGRDQGEVRNVPGYPELMAILRAYVTANGLKPGNRLFTGVRSDELLSMVVVRRAWDAARVKVLRPDLVNAPLAKKPYVLRHVRLTEQLNSGVPPAQVALWAGNSVQVLLATYVNCIAGQEADYKKRIVQAMRGQSSSGSAATLSKE